MPSNAAAHHLEADQLACEPTLLARQERALLTTLPDWLGQHFDRLQQAAVDAAPPHLSPAHWLDGFRADMRNLLLAELDLRLQPSEGLVAALRTTVTS